LVATLPGEISKTRNNSIDTTTIVMTMKLSRLVMSINMGLAAIRLSSSAEIPRRPRQDAITSPQ
jgi:hypothetical protein